MASGAHYEVQWHVTKHDAKDVADPSSMQDACQMTFIMGLTHHRVSAAQWKSIRARNPKVWGTIPHKDSEFFLVPRSWQDEKNIFLYFFTELKFIIFCLGLGLGLGLGFYLNCSKYLFKTWNNAFFFRSTANCQQTVEAGLSLPTFQIMTSRTG